MADKRNQPALENAAEIIKLFGGIRPMAHKMDVPVTTVQGWKKRDAIPGSRYNDVLKAARANDIDLSDILEQDVANENSFQDAVETASSSRNPRMEEEHGQAVEAGLRSLKPADMSAEHEPFMREIKAAERKAVGKSVWISVFMLAFGVAIAVLLLWPGQKQIGMNGDRIAALEGQTVEIAGNVDDLHEGQFFIMGLLPESLQEKIRALQERTDKVKTNVNTLARRVEVIANDVLAEDAGPLSSRIARLEEQLFEITGTSSGLSGLMKRVESLQKTMEGQKQLSRSFEDLSAFVMGAQDEERELETVLQAAQEESEALSQTLEGVSSEDLKAAAMLLILTKFRESVNRSAPFEEDLKLMQQIIGDKNPELNTAIIRLAPRASEGVLTTEGLSNEFKELAGEIVIASLKGEDISIQERAKARFHEILQVEKEGELITGTDTQAAVARAQKMLDEGDLEGAITELQSLNGDAAQTAQGWIDEAQFTLLARELQKMLTNNVLSGIGTRRGIPYMNGISGLKRAVKDLQRKIPQKKKMVRDPESGFTILPPGPRLPDFSLDR